MTVNNVFIVGNDYEYKSAVLYSGVEVLSIFCLFPVATPSGDLSVPAYNPPVYQNANSTLGSSLPMQAWTPNSQPSNQATNPYL